ncbi:hypothetical protein RNZ50_00530 [Paracoccaceae bacterium Fryx2]|nr:hypothetical protein [Paracoccaceae bacterium Fryx2]
MGLFRHVATFVAAIEQFVTGITDLGIAWIGGQPRLYAMTRPDGGLSVFDLAGDGAAGLLGTQAHQPGLGHLAVPQIGMLTGAAGSVILPVGLQNGAGLGVGLTGDGRFGGRVTFADGERPAPDLLATASQSIGGHTFVYASRPGSDRPVSYELTAAGDLRQMAAAGTGTGGSGCAAESLITLDVGARSFLIAASTLGDRVTAYSLQANGTLVETDVLDSASGIGLSRPGAVAGVTLHGASYVIMAGTGSSSLSVARLTPEGRLLPVDHVIDGLDTRFQSVTALTSFQIGERAFVLAGGADDGISLFTLLPDGRLIHLSSIADTLATTLTNVTALAAAVVGNRVLVFAAGEGEAGLTQFDLDLGSFGVSLASAAARIGGTARNDLLMATGSGAAALTGGAGDDILVGGAGAARLSGGEGADIFVIPANGQANVITDFQPGVDRLDLTLMPMLHSVGQLQITATATGAWLQFGGTVITLISADGTPILPGFFTSAGLLGLSRYAPVLLAESPSGATTGTAGPDLLRGTARADILDGLGGDDTLRGAGGNDRMFGDTGDDLIFGAAGADTLNGGSGADTLKGGGGNDRIDGGSGNDRAAGGGGRTGSRAGRATTFFWAARATTPWAAAPAGIC